MSKKSKASNQNELSSVPVVQETEPLFTRISPVGVKEDGRMYYVSDMGHVMTVAKLPYLALRSLLRHLADKDSAVYSFVEAEDPLHDAESVRLNLESRLHDSGNKCERALERMKAKGLYSPTIRGLRQLMLDRLPTNLGWPMDVILDMNLGLTGLEEWDADITDDFWLNAIELDIYLFHREKYLNSSDKTQWGVLVGQDYEFIWILVYLTTYGNALYLDMQDAKEEISKSKYRIQQLLALTQMVDEAKSEIRQQRVEFDKQSEGMKRELEGLRTDNGRLFHENARLKAKLELMEASLAAADDEAGQEFELDESEVQTEPAVDFEFPLPDTNVLFVGGHVRLQNKLKQLHPKWKFITTKMSYSLLDDNVKAKFVFFYTGHLSHKLFDKVRDCLGGVPTAYVTSQNLNRLNTEMLRAYNDYVLEHDMPAY